MSEFFNAVINHTFMQNALLAGVLASIACGAMGSFIVTRRITYIAGAIAHSVLGGMGLVNYLKVVHGYQFLHPLHGAFFAALLSAIVIGWISLKAKEREDTVIGAVWAIGMAVGVIFIAKTPGYNENLMSYLFGNILMVGGYDLVIIALLDLVVVVTILLFYNKLLAVCFDEQFARVRKINVEFYYILILCLTGLTVVILVSVVGLVMVIALLTLPAAIAGQFTRSIWQMILAAIALSILITTSGLAISFSPDLPAGATIIIVAGILYILSAIYKKIFRTP